MASNGSGGGNIDLNVDPDALGSQHIKTIAQAAKLGDYLPIRWSELPRTVPLTSIAGYNDEWKRAFVSMTVISSRKRAERLLTEDEIQGVAEAAAQMTRTLSSAAPLTLLTAAGFTKWGQKTYRFPFYSPKPEFSPDVFPSKTQPLLTGPQARQAWTALRFSLYAGVSHFLLKPFILVVASSAQMRAMEADPRLADLRQTLAKNLPHQQRQQQQRPQSQFAQRAQQAQREHAQGQQAQKPQSEPQQQQQEEQWTQPPPPPQQWQQQQQHQWQSRPQQQQPRQPQQPQPQQTESSGFDDYSNDLDDDFYDDASPMSRDEQRRQAWDQRRPTSGTGESTAWERLRHPGTSNEKFTPISKAPPGQYGWEALRNGKSPPPRPAYNDNDNDNRPTTGDYTFNNADEEKQLARNQAQKDFDAMLEKERQGESDRPSRWK